MESLVSGTSDFTYVITIYMLVWVVYDISPYIAAQCFARLNSLLEFQQTCVGHLSLHSTANIFREHLAFLWPY